MQVLVTGGCGFIGSAFCRLLIAEGHRILNLDSLTYAASEDAVRSIADDAGYLFKRGDINDGAMLGDLLARFQPDAVVNLAAETHVDRSIDDSSSFVQTNIVGTHRLLEAVRLYWRRLPAGKKKDFRFCHVSTDEVFGSLGREGKFVETTAYDPRSPYAACKAASDHLVRAWHCTYGLPTIITNCSNNYGPFQFPEKLIPLITLNAFEGQKLPIYGNGANVRDWLYVDDHTRALLLLLTRGRPGESYNIGGGTELANLQVVERICAEADRLLPQGAPHSRLITFVEDRPGHDLRYATDSSKIESEIGWRPAETFETGLRKTVQWYFERRDWWEQIRASRYKGERLGKA